MNELIVKKSTLESVRIIIPPTIFEDHRGIYTETYNRRIYSNAGIEQDFKSDCFIISYKDVLRGIHGDGATWKLVNCIHGRFYIVVVDCDLESKNFGCWMSMTLSETNRKQLLVPPRHGIGHLILSEKVIYHYKQTEYIEDKKEFVYSWDDKRFNISWGIRNPILSEKDSNAVGDRNFNGNNEV